MEKMEGISDVYFDSKLGITVVPKGDAMPDAEDIAIALAPHKIKLDGEAVRVEEPLYK